MANSKSIATSVERVPLAAKVRLIPTCGSISAAGYAIWCAPTRIEFVVENEQLIVSAWPAFDFLGMIILGGFSQPAERHIRGDGRRNVAPRNSSRNLVNQLRVALQSPPIP